jgi:hypothetical protein
MSPPVFVMSPLLSHDSAKGQEQHTCQKWFR